MPLTREVRLGAAAAAVLVVVFGLLTVLTASQRPRFEERVASSFSTELKTQAASERFQIRCDRVEAKEFACLTRRGRREIPYALTFGATGCWRATTPDSKARNFPPGFPRRLRACTTE